MNVPRLRFKDVNGKDFPKWGVNNLLDLSQNGFSNGVFNDPTKVGSGYKLVNVIDMYLDSSINEDSLPLIELSEAEFLKNKVEYGDVFFTRSSLVKEGIAYSNVYLNHSDDVTFDGHLVRMRPKKELINSVFLNYMLKTSKVRCQLVMRGKTATMTTIGQTDIASVIVSFPILPEQTKIANFLTAVDEKIAQLTQKGDLLARYKKGVMQQIFSQQLRFKDDDGRDFPVWEERTIENEVEFLSGYPFDGNDIKDDNNGIGLMRGINISEGFVRHSKEIDRYYSGDIKPLKKYLLIENDLVIGMDGSKVGKNSALIKKNDTNTLLVQRVARLRAKPDTSISFIYQHINSSKFHSYVDKVNTSSGIPHISAKQIKEFKVFFPVFEEQTKIANFLTTLDDKINHNQTQLNALKQYKKGLLQQMFV